MALDAGGLAARAGSLLFTHSSRRRFAARLNSGVGQLEAERMDETVYVFVGAFSSRDDACLYTEAQYEPEPDETASDEEYAAWEDRNPTWAMRKELGTYLDSDFIETIDGADRYSYLATMLVDKNAVAAIEERAPDNANILVLIFKEALGGFPAEMKSTEKLVYCGEYACRL